MIHLYIYFKFLHIYIHMFIWDFINFILWLFFCLFVFHFIPCNEYIFPLSKQSGNSAIRMQNLGFWLEIWQVDLMSFSFVFFEWIRHETNSSYRIFMFIRRNIWLFLPGLYLYYDDYQLPYFYIYQWVLKILLLARALPSPPFNYYWDERMNSHFLQS